MQLTIKQKWKIAIIVAIVALLWFLLGATGFFMGLWGIHSPFIFALIWTPVLILVIISIFKLKKVNESSGVDMITTMLILSVVLFLTANPVRLLIVENVTKDWTQITADGRFEYRLEVINVFQRNSRARLHVVDVNTREEIIIRTDIRTRGITSMSGESTMSPHPGLSPPEHMVMSTLTPTEKENIYILTTTDRGGMEAVTLEIDVVEKTARRIVQQE